MALRTAVLLLATQVPATVCTCLWTREVDAANLLQKDDSTADASANVTANVTGSDEFFPWPWNYIYKRVNGSLVATRKNITEKHKKNATELQEEAEVRAAKRKAAAEARKAKRAARRNRHKTIAEPDNATDAEEAADEEDPKEAEETKSAPVEAAPKKAEETKAAPVEAAPKKAEETKAAAVEPAPKKAEETKAVPVKAAPKTAEGTKGVEVETEAVEDNIAEDGSFDVKLIDFKNNVKWVKAHKGNHAKSLLRIVCEMSEMTWEDCSDRMKFILNNKKVMKEKDALEELGMMGNDVVRMMKKTKPSHRGA